jgi:hypothetical protein
MYDNDSLLAKILGALLGVFLVLPVLCYLACIWLSYGIETQLIPAMNLLSQDTAPSAERLFWTFVHVGFPLAFILRGLFQTSLTLGKKS